MAQHYEAPDRGRFQTSAGHDCRLFIGPIADRRSDTDSMGDLGGRPVHSADTAGWVRSALQSLARDPHMILETTAEKANLWVEAEVLKAYTMSITTEKVTNVVLRITYRHGSNEIDKQIYRGSDTSVNWVSGTDETQSAFNASLSQILDKIHKDIVSRCEDTVLRD